MKFDWAIWKSSADSSDMRFVHESDLPRSGLASVYRFTETDAKAMQALGSYKNFKGTVYSERLSVDADTEEASTACERRLEALQVGYQKFTTGNRGNHYHIIRSVAPSHSLPAVDKLFVKTNFPGCDVSFYHHVGLYRLEGAVHAKTGLRKELIKSVPGIVLDMTACPSEAPEAVNDSTVERSMRPVSVFDDEILRRMTVPAEQGNRHKHYIDLAVRLDTLNQAFDFAVGYIYNVDLMSGGGMPEKDIVRIAHWAYFERVK